MQYRFKEKAHINLQEAKARRSLIKRLPRDKRVVLRQDSRVNLGALGKGRSPSSSLSLIMRSDTPWILRKNLYPAGVHFPTWSIRADAPSRSLPTAGPRLALPPWFWKLRSGDITGASQLDGLGLPRAYNEGLNRWALFAGVLLLRVADGSASRSCADRPPLEGTLAAGSSDGEDPQHTRVAAARPGALATASVGRTDGGSAGQISHRQLVGVVRRIYDFSVLAKAQQEGGCGNPERSHATVWLGEVLACRAMEPSKNVGAVGTGPASSSYACSSSVCACGYCSAVALVAHGGHLGFGLFWFAETCRAYWAAKEGLGLTNRHLRKRRAVPPARSTENSASSSQQPACAHRLSRSGHVAFALNRLDPVVEQNLERIVASL